MFRLKRNRIVCPFEFKSMDEATGVFEGHAAIFGNVDLGGDRIVKGAFKDALREFKNHPIPLYWNHDEPIGTIEHAAEDDAGFFVRGVPLVNEVQRAAEVMALVRAKAVREMSFAYRVVKARTADDGVRELLKLKVGEVSLVKFAMNPAALVTAFKGESSEELLRAVLTEHAGMPADLAAAVAGAAWPIVSEYLCPVVPPVEADASAEAVEVLRKLTAALS